MVRLASDELGAAGGHSSGARSWAFPLLLMITSAVLPHVIVEAATLVPGRSLIPASRFFLIANPNAEAFQGRRVSPPRVWGSASPTRGSHSTRSVDCRHRVVLGPDRRRCRTLDAASGDGVRHLAAAQRVDCGPRLPTADQCRRAQLARLRVAVHPTAGVIMVIGGRLARKRLVTTWYWENPEIVQP